MMPRLTSPDVWLLAAVAGLVGIGVIMVFNVSYFHAADRYDDPFRFFRKHLLSLAIGGIVMLAVSRLRMDLVERWASVALLISIASLLLVLIPGVGVERGGARRWIILGGFGIQPAEIVKLTAVLFLARWISRHGDRL
jgi:cell division protein FtsW